MFASIISRFLGRWSWGAVAALLTVLSLAAQPASVPARNIVVLGDSIAAGYGLDPAESFPALLQKKIEAAGWKFTVVNAGVSGDTTAGGLRRIDWLLKRPVEVLVLELGGNDGLRGLPPEVTRTNLQGIIDRTRKKYPAAQIVITGMQMPANMGDTFNAAYQKLFSELAETNRAALVPFLLEGIAGRLEFNQPDLIHPTAEGQKRVADNIWKILQPVLARLESPR